MSTITMSRPPPPLLDFISFHPNFLSAAKPSDLGTLGVVLVVVVGGWGAPLLELNHVQFFRGVFKSCQICSILSKPK